jgi:hypothetical protein
MTVYTQYVWPGKVRSEWGCPARVHSLMVSSQEEDRNSSRLWRLALREQHCKQWREG